MRDEETTARLRQALAGLDLGHPDGRVGIQVLLAELERAIPGAILRSAARVQLRSLGSRTEP